MIEDKRRTKATDFDDTSAETLGRKSAAPLDMGAMLGDDDLDNLCDAVLTDLDRTPADRTQGD